MVKNMLLFRRAVENDLLFALGQIAEGHVGAHAHLAANVGHQRPHQAVPGRDGPAVDGERIVRHQRAHVHRAHAARSAAFGAGSLRVEGQLLGGGGIKARAAFGAGKLLARCDGKRGRQIMAVGAAMAGQAGVHQAQAVEQLGARAEGAADAGHARPLMQRQRGGHIQHVVHRGLGCLRHAAAGVGGQRLQIAAGALGVQHAQRQRGLARAGYPGDADDLIEGDIHINVFEVVHPGAANKHFIDHDFSPDILITGVKQNGHPDCAGYPF